MDRISHLADQRDRGGGGGQTVEGILELNYRAQITLAVHIQRDLQYVPEAGWKVGRIRRRLPASGTERTPFRETNPDRTMNALTTFFVATGLIATAATASAQDAKPSEEGDQYWSTECTGTTRRADALTCTAVQSILIADTKQLLFQIKVVVPAGSDAPVMSLQGPLNVFLPGGFALSVDGADLAKVAVSNCNAHGCFGAFKLEPAMIDTLKSGESLRISFLSAPKASQFVETPLAGFTRAMNAIE